jgi:hypothetical protein
MSGVRRGRSVGVMLRRFSFEPSVGRLTFTVPRLPSMLRISIRLRSDIRCIPNHSHPILSSDTADFSYPAGMAADTEYGVRRYACVVGARANKN